jgi:hypothetical protein
MNGTDYAPPTTTFTISQALHESHPWRTIQFGPPFESLGWTNTGTTIKVPTAWLFPNNAFGEPINHPEFNFLYTGTVYKYENQFTGAFSSWTGIGGFVTPWSPVSTSGRSSITFNVNWNITNLIVQYQGADNTANTADDVFVFADKFWERFSFTVD